MAEKGATDPIDPQGELTRFAQRTWVVLWIIALFTIVFLFLWFATKIVLLFFAGVFEAIILRTAGGWLIRKFRWPPTIAIGLVVLVLCGLFTLIGWLIAPGIAVQARQLTEQLPKAVQDFEKYISQFEWGRAALNYLPSGGTGGSLTVVLQRAKSFVSVTGTVIAGLAFIIFVGFYFATSPELYARGFLRLLPPHLRPRGGEVLQQLQINLRNWLFGQLASMLLVGILIAIGLWAIGVPLALTIGLLACFLDFIPLIGPLIPGTLAVLLGFSVSPMHSVYALLVFIAMQFVEGHVFIPIIQRKAAKLPPVITILAMIFFGETFGFLGLLLATPLAVVIMTLIQMVYIGDVLKDKPPIRRA